ncbi:MAG: UDP-N-acetylmuramoyl-tripeptide--D-alanyl-D-alanine ligase [Eubacterium sp.]|nr:UDP-N-acetylmuramoyl-tripeptide--D-alanyl-D-alanine ligase [Eubacterium sp.]
MVLYYIAVGCFYAALIASCVLNFHHYMHMFQLNSYHAGEQFKWIKDNLLHVICRHIFTVISAVLLIIALSPQDYKLSSSMLIFAAAVGMTMNINSLAYGHKKVKKKLVYTPRVIRMAVTSAIIYAAVLTLTAVFCGFSMVTMSVACGMQILTAFIVMIANLINKPIEHGVNMHYINEAKAIIDGLPFLTVVGLTGSYGKTSTKFFLEKLLGAKYNVLMTPESYNTTMGVVKTIRGSLKATHEIFLCEMGAKGVGEIKEICDIVKPKYGVITSIGPQHLETFKSVENIINTKFELADSLPEDGIAFLNYDNEYIKGRGYKRDKVTYGLSGDGEDYYADNITVNENGTHFTLHHGEESKEFTTKLIGEHNVQNIVGAIATANTLGVELDALVLPVRRLESVPHRLQIIKRGKDIVIDDAFNSNPSGAKAALDTLAVFDGYKILISPGMVELGEKEYELNKNFGKQAAAVCDYVIAVGEKQAVPIKDGLLEAGYPEDKIFVAKTLDVALKQADSLKTGGKKKIMLLENDLPDNY